MLDKIRNVIDLIIRCDWHRRVRSACRISTRPSPIEPNHHVEFAELQGDCPICAKPGQVCRDLDSCPHADLATLTARQA